MFRRSGSAREAYGPLARRLILLFIVVSLLPLIVSDFLAIYATNQINQGLQTKTESRRAHLVGRQVFDKLLSAKLLIESFPDSAVAKTDLPGFGRVFTDAQFAIDAGNAKLVRAWAAAVPSNDSSSALHPMRGSSQQVVTLRVEQVGSAQPRILIASSSDKSLRWIAEIDDDFLWSPVKDASDDNAWRVVDASGVVLFESAAASLAKTSSVQSRIYLGAEFGAADWIFESEISAVPIVWQGLSVAVWLALVAAATLAIIAILSLWKIRETLQPLSVLTESTQLLAEGKIPASVNVQRDDEVGELASAFNHMATQIAQQLATLSDLAAIDRDILKGVSVSELAQRVVDLLAPTRPGAKVRFDWLDADHVVRQVQAISGDSAPAGHETLNPEEFRALAGPAALAGGIVVERRYGMLQTAIPIVMAGTTRAAIVSLSSEEIGAETALASLNLRDRMAVAFAAKDREAELIRLATHDSLTGLVSRYQLHQVLDAVVSSHASSSLLFIDLDHFKDINDSRGHHAGDELLCKVGERLRICCPQGGVLARQGGDEFALVLPAVGKSDACAIALSILNEVRKPLMLESGECSLTASIGIAVFPTHAQSREGLLRCADVALYATKAAGRNGFHVFNSALDKAEQTRVRLIADIRDAVKRLEFEVHFQPRVNSQSLRLTGAEALLRWRHPQRGLIAPDDFIRIAEDTGAIHYIGDWVLSAVVEQIAAWRKSGTSLRVSVNVSPKQFESGTLHRHIENLLSKFEVPPALLEIEITENVMVGDPTSAFAQLTAIRSLGVRVALDDFGTGYSSMALLSELPFDVMKIDRSFVARLVAPPYRSTMIRLWPSRNSPRSDHAACELHSILDVAAVP